MTTMNFRRTAMLIALALATPVAALAQAVVIQRVGPGFVTGLSADGRVATGQQVSDYQTFRWTAREGMVALGRGTLAPLGQISGLPAISADGKVIGSTILADAGTYATMGRWTLGGGWQQIAPPLPPGGGMIDNNIASVFGMSTDGSAVTGLFWRTDGKAHGGVWTAATNLVDMGSDGGSSRIDGANADGSVVAGWDEDPVSGIRRAAVWMHGVKTVLDTSGWPSEASAVNAAGTIMVGQAADENNNFHESAVMWKWNGSAWVRTVLGIVAGGRNSASAYANALSDDGRIVAGIDRPNGGSPQSVGFIWTAATGMTDANQFMKAIGHDLSAEFTITNIMAMTPSGAVIAAYGQNTQAPFGASTILIRRLAGASAP